MDKVFKFLRFANLLEYNSNKLSISNIAVVVIITKMAVSDFDWAAAAALMVGLLNYAHKRSIAASTTSKEQASQFAKTEEIAGLKSEISSINENIQSFQAVKEAAQKAVDDVKKLVSTSNLANALNPRGRRE